MISPRGARATLTLKEQPSQNPHPRGRFLDLRADSQKVRPSSFHHLMSKLARPSDEREST
jgi:hypothetical protein